MTTPPKVCPKCGSRSGWDNPIYRERDDFDGDEHLEYKCSFCRFPLRLPCADAKAEA